VRLVIGERAIDVPARPVSPEFTPTIDVTIPDDIPVGTYPLRIEVDGAPSVLALDPGTGTYATPALQVTA